MQITINAGFNICPDGTIVMDGDHAPGVSGPVPFEALGISVTRRGPGDYLVTGPALSLPGGWRATVYRDENDEPTSKLRMVQGDGSVEVFTTDPATGDPADITYLLTLRVAVTVMVPDMSVPEEDPAA